MLCVFRTGRSAGSYCDETEKIVLEEFSQKPAHYTRPTKTGHGYLDLDEFGNAVSLEDV